MSNVEFGIKLKYDGKEVDGGVAVSREQLRQLGEEGKKAGETAATGIQSVAKSTKDLGQSAGALKPHIAQLDQMGMSAKATAAALRGVPAQFTDIITSLQGGQAPMTVLLQQGGQLKDMFGGAGNAAKALGGYVMGLVNPATVAAAAGAALGLAYYQGAAEATAFNRTLILSGNVAATSSGQLQDMARNVATATGATRGAIAETLNEIVGTGKVSVDMLGKVTQAAIDMERAGGAAASDTVKEFAALGDAPASAVLKLNEKYHFLTASVYEQIKALQDQGKEIEATKLAQSTYADALENRVPAMVENLGLIEKAWKGISGAAKGAWDFMLNVGREKTLDQKLAEAIGKRDGQYDYSAKAVIKVPGQEKIIAQLEAEIESRDRLQRMEAADNKQREAGLKWEVEKSKYLDKEEKKRLEILRVTNEATAAGASQKELATALAKIEENYAAKKSASAKAQKDDYADLFNRQEQMAKLYKEAGKETAEIAKANEAYAKSIDAIYAPMEKEAEALELQLSNYGLTRAEIEASTIARLEENRAVLASQQGLEALIPDLDREIAARKRIRDASAGIEASKAGDELEKESRKASQKSADDWQKTSDKIGDGLTDALMRGFESGKGFAENARDTITNMFKSMVLRPMIQATVMGGLSAMGMGMGSASASDGTSSTGGMGNWLSMGNSAYNAYSGGTGGLYNGFAMSNAGQSLGLSAMGAGALGSGFSTVAGGAAVSTTSLAGIEAASAGVTSTAGAGLTTLGAAIPYIGLAIAAAYAIYQAVGKGGTPHAGGIAISDASSTVTPSSITGILDAYGKDSTGAVANQFLETDWTKRFSTGIASALTPTSTAIAKMLDSTATTFGGTSGYKVGMAFSADGEDPSRGRYGILDASGKEVFDWGRRKFDKDSSTGMQEFVAATGEGVLSVLDSMDLPKWADGILAALGDAPNIDTMQSVVTQINAIAQAAEILSPAFKMTEDDFASLYVAIGGNAVSTYYQAAFSNAEKQFAQFKQVSAAFDDLGFALPTSIAGFRELVESQDSTTESGRKTIASLMGLTSAMSSVQSATDAAKAGVSTAVFDLRTPEQQAALRRDALAKASADVGVLIPQTAADLVALADSIDYTSESGIGLALALPSLVTAFKAVSDAASTTETKSTAAASAVSAATDAASAAYDALSRSVDAEKARIDAAYQAQSDALNTAAESAVKVRDSISSLADSLARSVQSVAVGTAESDLQRRVSAQSSLNSALSAARSGQSLVPYSDQINAAITDLSKPSENLYADFVDYARAQGQAAGTLADLTRQAKAQKSVADLTLDAINASIRAADVQHDQDISALDQTLEVAQSQLNALNGINDSILSLSSALSGFNAAIAAANAVKASVASPNISATVSANGAILSGGMITTPGGYSGTLDDAKKIVTKAFNSSSPADFRAGAIANGLSAAMIDEMYGFPPGTANVWAKDNGLQPFAAGGVASAGLYIAGEHGPELISSDVATRVYPAEQTSALMDRLQSPTNNMDELVREIRELRKVVERQAEQLASIKTSTGQTADILDSNTGGGGPSLVKVIA